MEIAAGASLTGNYVPDATDEQDMRMEQRQGQQMDNGPSPESGDRNGPQQEEERLRRQKRAERERVIQQQQADKALTDENRFRQAGGITAVASADALVKKNATADPVQSAENVKSAISMLMTGGVDIGEIISSAAEENMNDGQGDDRNKMPEPPVAPAFQPNVTRRDS